MLVTDDAATTLHVSTADALANAEVRLQKLREMQGRHPTTPSSASIERAESERNNLQRAADVETIELWEYHQRQLSTHRRLAREHSTALIAIGSAYPAAVRREQARWDAEHAKNGGDTDGTEE